MPFLVINRILQGAKLLYSLEVDEEEETNLELSLEWNLYIVEGHKLTNKSLSPTEIFHILLSETETLN